MKAIVTTTSHEQINIFHVLTMHSLLSLRGKVFSSKTQTLKTVANISIASFITFLQTQKSFFSIDRENLYKKVFYIRTFMIKKITDQHF